MSYPPDRAPRGYRRPPYGRPGHAGRDDRLALPASFRLAEPLRVHPRRRKGRPLPDFRHVGGGQAEADVPARFQRPADPLSHPRRRGRGRGLHADPARTAAPSATRTIRSSGSCAAFAASCRSGWSAGRRSITAGARSAPVATASGCRFACGGVGVALATPLPLVLGNDGASCEFVLREGQEIPVVLAQSKGEPPRLESLAEHCPAGVPPDPPVLAAVDHPEPLPGTLAGDGQAFLPRPEALDLRAVRRDRGGAHDEPSREDRG